MKGQCYLVRYCDDFLCLVQKTEGARHVKQALEERFAKFDLEIHPEKTRVISFGRYERENARRQRRRANTFDFLGFTHYCGVSRKGKFIVGRTTSRKKCKDLRSQSKALNWSGFNEYLRHYPLSKPRIMHNLYTLSPGF